MYGPQSHVCSPPLRPAGQRIVTHGRVGGCALLLLDVVGHGLMAGSDLCVARIVPPSQRERKYAPRGEPRDSKRNTGSYPRDCVVAGRPVKPLAAMRCAPVASASDTRPPSSSHRATLAFVRALGRSLGRRVAFRTAVGRIARGRAGRGRARPRVRAGRGRARGRGRELPLRAVHRAALAARRVAVRRRRDQAEERLGLIPDLFGLSARERARPTRERRRETTTTAAGRGGARGTLGARRPHTDRERRGAPRTSRPRGTARSFQSPGTARAGAAAVRRRARSSACRAVARTRAARSRRPRWLRRRACRRTGESDAADRPPRDGSGDQDRRQSASSSDAEASCDPRRARVASGTDATRLHEATRSLLRAALRALQSSCDAPPGLMNDDDDSA